MKSLSLHPRAEVLPALHGRAASASGRATSTLLERAVQPAQRAARGGGKLSFDQRSTRSSRFPLEESLARIPEPPRLGRFLDIEV